MFKVMAHQRQREKGLLGVRGNSRAGHPGRVIFIFKRRGNALNQRVGFPAGDSGLKG